VSDGGVFDSSRFGSGVDGSLASGGCVVSVAGVSWLAGGDVSVTGAVAPVFGGCDGTYVGSDGVKPATGGSVFAGGASLFAEGIG
jgi:hypothetical protein